MLWFTHKKAEAQQGEVICPSHTADVCCQVTESLCSSHLESGWPPQRISVCGDSCPTEYCSSSSAANSLPVLDSFGSGSRIKVKLELYSWTLINQHNLIGYKCIRTTILPHFPHLEPINMRNTLCNETVHLITNEFLHECSSPTDTEFRVWFIKTVSVITYAIPCCPNFTHWTSHFHLCLSCNFCF